MNVSQIVGSFITLIRSVYANNLITPSCNKTATSGFLTEPELTSLIMEADCLNIYPEENCSGPFVRYIPGIFAKMGWEGLKNHRWENGTLVKEGMQVKSVGPCFDKCDPRNWEGVEESGVNHNVTLTLYDKTDFKGNETIVELSGEGCIPLPGHHFTFWRSMQLSGNDSTSCIELHTDPGCGKEFVQFRPSYPHLYDFNYWKFGKGLLFFMDSVAVSLCGKHCDNPVPDVKSGTDRNKDAGANVVTIFDAVGYYGNFLNINLTEGCVTLNESTFLTSIQTYEQCVIIFDEPNCQEKQRSYTLQTEGMEKEYYVQKLLTRTIPEKARSLKLCPKLDGSFEHERKQKTGTPEQTSGTWSFVWHTFVGLVLIGVGIIIGKYSSKYCTRFGYGLRIEDADKGDFAYELQA